jgi:hypothetical protein
VRYTKLNKLPRHMRTKEWIKSEIKYELHKGVHTYHQCECGRKACRSTMCSLCWEDILKHLK